MIKYKKTTIRIEPVTYNLLMLHVSEKNLTASEYVRNLIIEDLKKNINK